MNKRALAGVVVGGLILFAIATSGSNGQNSTSNSTQQSKSQTQSIEKITPVCDGTSVTSNCDVEGISYATYVFHAAVAEVSHTETVTTYTQKVVSYCTLCNDGTYSPSCATGRGACSYHGGVSQWNAPVYRDVPEYTTKTVIDAPAQAEYYEKVTK